MSIQETLLQNAHAYASRHKLQLAERLGFGIHGIVHVAKNNKQPAKTAIKAHSSAEPYFRELRVYQRLRQAAIREIKGFNVPELIRHDDHLRILEMTIVRRPFVLDFAGAYLDMPPDFSKEVWDEWEIEKREQFGSRWPEVLNVLSALEDLGIHMIDVSPGNIRF
jgi:hypothetical protein